jgi:hypothetical protein
MKDGEALCPGHADAPAIPQPSAPVVACKAPTWCGMSDDFSVNEKTTEGMARSEAYHADESGNYGIVRENTVYCSDACAPPLAAQPAEAKGAVFKCGCGVDEGKAHRGDCPRLKAKPAEQPKSEKGQPRCGNNGCKTPLQNVAQRWCSFTDGSPAVLEWSCEPCHLKDEAEFAELMMFATTGISGILRDPAIPERIVKPPMAHIAGMHDDDLIGGAR